MTSFYFGEYQNTILYSISYNFDSNLVMQLEIEFEAVHSWIVFRVPESLLVQFWIVFIAPYSLLVQFWIVFKVPYSLIVQF